MSEIQTIAAINSLAKNTELSVKIYKHAIKSRAKALGIIQQFADQLGIDFQEYHSENAHWFKIENDNVDITTFYNYSASEKAAHGN